MLVSAGAPGVIVGGATHLVHIVEVKVSYIVETDCVTWTLELVPTLMVLVTGQVVTDVDTLGYISSERLPVLGDNLHDSCDNLLSRGWWSWGGRSNSWRCHTFGANGQGFSLVYR